MTSQSVLAAPRYVEFATLSNFAFLRGASHAEELVATGISLGLTGLGLADINSVAGVVRAHGALRDLRKQYPHLAFRYHPGARLAFTDGTPDILAYPLNRAGWGRLCRLLTLGNRRAEKSQCHLALPDLLAHADDLALTVLPWTQNGSRGEPLVGGARGRRSPSRHRFEGDLLATLAEAAPGRTRLAARMSYCGLDRRTLAETAAVARAARVPLLAVNDVLYHAPARRPLQDVLTCIRTHTTLETAGRQLEANAERHLKPPAEMARLFRDHPAAVAETLALSQALTFSLDELKYEYPDEVIDGFTTAQEALVHFTFAGAAKRYPDGLPDKVRFALAHEIELIGQLGYAQYFLTVFDIVRFARGQGILCQGRGSAANSAVCFCLGITEVDPDKSDLLFERFVSANRREPPDIDVDFEHERREEVIQYIYRRYGRERAGLAATVISYRARSSIREVGKVFGLAEDTLDAMSGSIWGWGAEGIDEIDTQRSGVDRASPIVHQTFDLARQIAGFPRHLSQHVGGFVITRGRLDELVPIQNAAMVDRTVIEWDKDDLDTLGILKVDVLALGMLSCLRNCFNLLRQHYDRDLTIATIPAEDAAVYRMLQRADSLGVFQVESRAQMSMLPRLKPEKFYDLVIEVAIVRPGPIQGDMVHPYLRRKQGLEQVSYPSRELEAVLGKTLGVPLFQEQAMKIAIVAAGFTPSEADGLRRAMATFRKVGTIGTFQTKMVEGMVANGYERAFAERCFKQLEGFGEYGFPESHAASFALLVYASCWMKCHYPDVFAAALLNAQPLGFYAPAQIVRDAREHGTEARAPDVNASDWDATLEPSFPSPPPSGGEGRGCDGAAVTSEGEGPPRHTLPQLHPRHRSMARDIWSTRALRLGLREIKGLREDAGRLIAERRGRGYDSVRDVWLRTGLETSVLERFADADAFGSLGLTRRDALWAVKALGRTGDAAQDLPLFARPPGPQQEPDVALPAMPPGEEVVNDYRFLKMSLKAHPIQFVRSSLDAMRVVRNEHLPETAPGRRISVAGLVLVRQRPGSAKGVIFMTLEDEGGVANVIVWPKVFEKFRPVILSARFVVVHGRLQSEHGIIHIIADRIDDRTDLLAQLAEDTGCVSIIAHADEVKRPQGDMRERRVDAEVKRRERLAEVNDRVYEKPRPVTVKATPPQLALPLAAQDIAVLDVPARATRHALPKGRNFR
jgi:error-prone DNA polymerase